MVRAATGGLCVAESGATIAGVAEWPTRTNGAGAGVAEICVSERAAGCELVARAGVTTVAGCGTLRVGADGGDGDGELPRWASKRVALGDETRGGEAAI